MQEELLSLNHILKGTVTEYWCDKANRLHRNTDRPAVITNAREFMWYNHGLQHRGGDKPAFISPYKNEWLKKGERHRDNDKPAVVYWLEPLKMWYRRGKLHRSNDKPAYVAPGVSEWWTNGEIHRDNDKPAFIALDVSEWWSHGEIHRDNDLPAIVFVNGIKKWYRRGKIHREGDKPAYVVEGEYYAWYWEGKRHRFGTEPAVISHWTNRKEWWKYGIEYTELEIRSAVKISLWYRRMKQRRFILLVWRTMTPIYFHPLERGGLKAIKALTEFDIEKVYNQKK